MSILPAQFKVKMMSFVMLYQNIHALDAFVVESKTQGIEKAAISLRRKNISLLIHIFILRPDLDSVMNLCRA